MEYSASDSDVDDPSASEEDIAVEDRSVMEDLTDGWIEESLSECVDSSVNLS